MRLKYRIFGRAGRQYPYLILEDDDTSVSFGPTLRQVHTTYRYFLGDLLAIPKAKPILLEINNCLGKDSVKKVEQIFEIFDDRFDMMKEPVAKFVSRLDFGSLSSNDKKLIQYIESAMNDLCDAQIAVKTRTGEYALGKLGREYLKASLRTRNPLRSFHRLIYFRIIGHFLQQAEKLSQFLLKSKKELLIISGDKEEYQLRVRCPIDMIDRYALINAEGRPHLSRGSADNNYPHSLSLDALNRFLGFVMSLRRELFKAYSQVSGSVYADTTIEKQAGVFEGILSTGDRPFLVRESSGGYTRLPDPVLPAMVGLTLERYGHLSDVFRLCEVLRNDFSIFVDPEDVLTWIEASKPKAVSPNIAKPLLSQNFSRFIARLNAFQLARQEADGRIALRLE